ncbi:metallophosphoesterase family protein [Falsiroseomonas stagni]|uniref:Calcineurin-like phosphoesterase n=1 Tax=Falsiroseomonas stagni DSM 19981 TaxID=1123062 RepID=A0A1I4EIR9_9PROT|nr:metallophosphoesterase [Falsiroseomonas stagni]SFL05103.1 Calcineurin-like phosphoesterase [Falsiroseomonas stagni DSM 19981]
MSKIVFLSDLHLSPTHGFFWENFRLARDAADQAGAEAVVVNGDLCINGPDSDAEMDFARAALGKLRTPVLALPGNHDVGDEPPGQDLAQLVDEARLDRWDARFGTDRFALDAGAWRLIGVNAQLFGSGLEREREQWDWLEGRLIASSHRRIALVLHKPLFIEDEGETAETASCMTPGPRAALLALLRRHRVGLVISGHLHAERDRVVGGIRHLWLPALAFLGSGDHGGRPAVGAVVVDFAGAEASVMPLAVPPLAPHDLAAIKGHGRYRFLRDMPASPPPAEPASRPAAE